MHSAPRAHPPSTPPVPHVPVYPLVRRTELGRNGGIFFWPPILRHRAVGWGGGRKLCCDAAIGGLLLACIVVVAWPRIVLVLGTPTHPIRFCGLAHPFGGPTHELDRVGRCQSTPPDVVQCARLASTAARASSPTSQTPLSTVEPRHRAGR